MLHGVCSGPCLPVFCRVLTLGCDSWRWVPLLACPAVPAVDFRFTLLGKPAVAPQFLRLTLGDRSKPQRLRLIAAPPCRCYHEEFRAVWRAAPRDFSERAFQIEQYAANRQPSHAITSRGRRPTWQPMRRACTITARSFASPLEASEHLKGKQP